MESSSVKKAKATKGARETTTFMCWWLEQKSTGGFEPRHAAALQVVKFGDPARLIDASVSNCGPVGAGRGSQP